MEVLSIPEEAPVKDQKYGWLWFTLVVIEGAIIFFGLFALMSFLLAKVLGWSKDTYIGILIKGEYPQHWYKR